MTLLDSGIQKSQGVSIRFDWSLDEIQYLLKKPLMDLVWEAQIVHRSVNPEYKVQLASLLSVKTGGCEEDCSYCSQSMHNSSDVAGQSDFDVKGVWNKLKQLKMRELIDSVWDGLGVRFVMASLLSQC